MGHDFENETTIVFSDHLSENYFMIIYNKESSVTLMTKIMESLTLNEL